MKCKHAASHLRCVDLKIRNRNPDEAGVLTPYHPSTLDEKSPCGGPLRQSSVHSTSGLIPTLGISQTHLEYLLAKPLDRSVPVVVRYILSSVYNLDILHRPSMFSITHPDLL
ncbi:hypothetical protein AVEN_209950-1 [Araneus ventricosus]|uniref:Uncharacterized protein n=1 Tax=Araneus ventricosus TaxID=182803 RepID=A0A4Y2DBG4_ARAVE|nr:hypothetical protein AVEN_209950-1 [Araneus ventricosus]